MAMRTARVPAQFCAMATVLLVGRVQAQTNCLNFACPAGQSRVANPSAVTCANEAGGTCTSVTCCAYQCNSYGCGTGYTNYGSGLQCPSAYYGGCSRNYCCRSTAGTTGGTTGGTTDGTTGGTTDGTTGGTTDGTTGGTTDGTTGGGTAADAAGTCETHTCATTGTTKVGNPAAVACSINTNGGICDDDLCCAFQCASYPCANGAENWGAALQCRSKFHGGCSQEFCCKALSVDTTTIASTTTPMKNTAPTTAAPTTTDGGNNIAPVDGTTTNGGNNIAPIDDNTGGGGEESMPVNTGGGVIIAGGVESMPGNAEQAVAYGEALTGLWSATKHVPQLTPSLTAGFAVATVGAAAAAATAGLVVRRQTGRPQDAEPLVEQLEADGQ